jgi:hydrogenase expression/formation protein HypE
MVLEESSLPVPPPVAAACELLGLDPLYVANEGVLIGIVPEAIAAAAVAALQEFSLGTNACVIGKVTSQHPGMVVMHTQIGGTRVVDMLPGDQLPRIC